MQPAPFDGMALALVLFLMFTWGLNQVAIKVGNQGFNPMLMASARSVLGGGLVFLWCQYKKIPLFNLDGTFWPGILAGLLFGSEFVLIFMAMDYTNVGRVTLMMNMMPFWVAIGSHFLLSERMSLQAVIGMLIAFAGVFLVFSDRVSSVGAYAYIGDLMALAGGIMWGMTNIVIKRSSLTRAAPEKVLLYQLAVASIVPLPFMTLSGSLMRSPDMWSIIAFLFQSVFVVAFTYPLWFWMLRRYPVSKLSNFAFLTPAFGVLMSGILLGEALGWKIFAALILIALGLIIINRPVRTGSHKAA
ncbi:DMT family transporter [Paenochrobactrum sp. BZR 588]|uniref:DMT family transporter n=1 Tax=unclassified Paenochrobactrum TaxID=2639760 RepID=UPI0038521802